MPSNAVFDSFKYDSQVGNVTLVSDTFYMMLVSGFTPNAATQLKRSDITGEVSGAGYTTGGNPLTSVTVTNQTGSNQTQFASANVSWSGSTISATGAVIYKHRGGASSADNLVCYLDFGGTYSDTAGTFTVNCPGSGWLTLS